MAAQHKAGVYTLPPESRVGLLEFVELFLHFLGGHPGVLEQGLQQLQQGSLRPRQLTSLIFLLGHLNNVGI